jgi:hypothetical protein
VFDYDNQFIPAEKYDDAVSYKKAFCYFLGIAQIGGLPFFVENRGGNANVKYLQAETIEKVYQALEENDVKIEQSCMDCVPPPRRSSRPWPLITRSSISEQVAR